MIKKSRRAAETVFYVPIAGSEGHDGQLFIGMLKRFLNTGAWRVKLRGRNEDRKGAEQSARVGKGSYHQDLPLDKATYAAVYLDRTKASPLVTVRRDWYAWANGELSEIPELKQQLKDSVPRAEVREIVADANKEIDRHKEQAFESLLAAAAAREPSWTRVWADVKKLLVRPL